LRSSTQIRLVAVMPPEHALAGSASLPVADVLKYPFIAREEGSGTREVTFEYLRGAGLEPANLTVVMELGSPESIKGAIEAGMGISILSRSTIDKELQLGTLTCVELDPRLERPFSFVNQKHRYRARAIEEVLDFARHYCRDEGA
jgi:DNA-binding transcriptional LysR family regulator